MFGCVNGGWGDIRRVTIKHNIILIPGDICTPHAGAESDQRRSFRVPGQC